MRWLQKFLIVTVAFLTLGIITPTHDIWNGLQDKGNTRQVGPTVQSDEAYFEFTESTIVKETPSIEDVFIETARELSYEKFGSKIGPVIGDEFDEVIFPKIDEVIRMTLNDAIEPQIGQLAISEKPAGNYSEKIFNVYDKDEGKDLILFHVRTDKRPQDGYFFNFHYHLADDDFTKHYSLGDIYWSKNTPPKWLS
ncbi:YpjP family protein [Sporosarcina ureilytica]|uniref:Cell division protein FtsK n=1 Tax=Sporosarcina ureilytica TaxID=298596 RepID=A0A1D8JG42_9BACL|nr:YpjP family protein [Sporosarcina ureilytica]AOV07685.1 hypothetical protein BI350_09160 [Sporosarcina ureilytica]